LSFSSWDNNGLTALEQAAGVGHLLSGGSVDDYYNSFLSDSDFNDTHERNQKIVNTEKYKTAAKLVAGLNSNREIKLALIHKAYHDGLESAIVRFMTKEKLPRYYASILKSSECIEKLVEGILYKVCKIEPTNTLADQIGNLSGLLHKNSSRLTAYDRVTQIQQFIHCTVDQRFGEGAAQSIPVIPMKNALCASRLHFNISDVIDRQPSYIEYIDTVSHASLQIEYDDPRPSTALSGKRSWPKWRVRHLRTLSYYFPEYLRGTIQALKQLDDNASSEGFIHNAVLIYVTNNVK
jgi:hypothetical protein